MRTAEQSGEQGQMIFSWPGDVNQSRSRWREFYEHDQRITMASALSKRATIGSRPKSAASAWPDRFSRSRASCTPARRASSASKCRTARRVASCASRKPKARCNKWKSSGTGCSGSVPSSINSTKVGSGLGAQIIFPNPANGLSQDRLGQSMQTRFAAALELNFRFERKDRACPRKRSSAGALLSPRSRFSLTTPYTRKR